MDPHVRNCTDAHREWTPNEAKSIVEKAIRARKISNQSTNSRNFDPELPEGDHVPETVVVTVIRGRKLSCIEIPYHHEGVPQPAGNSNSQNQTQAKLKKLSSILSPKQGELKISNSQENLAVAQDAKHRSLAKKYEKAINEKPEDLPEPVIITEDDFAEIRPEQNIIDAIRERRFSVVLTPSNLGKKTDRRGSLLHLHPPHSEHVLTLPEAVFDLDAKPYNRISTQILAACAANMGAFALGTVLAWSATGIPSLRESGDFPELDPAQEAWVGSLLTIGALAACPFAASTMVNFGRRRTMMFVNAPFMLGWALIAFAKQFPYIGSPIYTIYFGRILTGFCAGAYSVVAPAYVAEISHERMRGALAAGFDQMISLGMMYIFLIGAFYPWDIQAMACGIIPIVCHILLMIAPDSPRFLVEQGKVDEAGKALAWLYGVEKDELSVELAMLKNSVEESKVKPVNFDRVVMKMSVLKPILICIIIMFFYVMTAVDAITFYCVDIFISTDTPSLDPVVAANIVALAQVIACLPAGVIVHKFSRRSLLIVSFLFIAVSYAGIGSFYVITKNDEDGLLHEKFTWLPVSALCLYMVAYSVGIGPLSMALLGEVVPSHIRGMTSCIALMVRWALGFGVTVMFMAMGEGLGFHITWWIFGGICGLGVVFVYFCVPETRGKSLDDIQFGFIKKSKLKAHAAMQQVLNNQLQKQLHTKI